MVTRRQATAWAGLALVLGLSSLFLMLLQVSPYLPDGTVNMPAVALFVLCLALFVFGVSSLAALWLHRRWPALAGAARAKSTPRAAIALRQGVLMAMAVALLAILAVLQELDVFLVLITFGLMGLLEAYVQSRASR
jgi:hypothetical protein